MSNDLEILAEINGLLARDALDEERPEKLREGKRSPIPKGLLQVPLPLIIPAGYDKGVAFSEAGNVVGIKLGVVSIFASELLAEICKLTHLERLVFFTAGRPFTIPIEIRNLRKLKLLWFGSHLKSFPKELLDIDLPFVQPTDVSGPSSERLGPMLLQKIIREPTQHFIAELNEQTRSQETVALDGGPFELAETVLTICQNQ
jgi:hypothetical protein